MSYILRAVTSAVMGGGERSNGGGDAVKVDFYRN